MNSVQPIPAKAHVVSTQTISKMVDDTLNKWLLTLYTNNNTVVLVHSGHRCKVFDATFVNAPLFAADPDKESSKTLKSLR